MSKPIQLECKTVREKLMLYTDDLLDPSDIHSFEEHFANCTDCAVRLRETQDLTKILSSQKNIMCPEPWEIFDYARGLGPASWMEKHISSCVPCKLEYQELKSEIDQSFAGDEGKVGVRQMLLRLGRKFTDLFEVWDIRECLSFQKLWFIPAAVAVIIMIAVTIPTQTRHVEIAVSAVQWNPKLSLMGPPENKAIQGTKSKIAVLVYYDPAGFSPDQAEIDRWYSLLTPTADLKTNYDFIEPKYIRDLAGQFEKLKPEKIESILAQKLGVSNLITLTVRKPDSDNYEIEGSLWNVGSDIPRKKVLDTNVTTSQLDAQLETTLAALLR